MDDTKRDDTDYASEVRFGVVMYGGVSLAIYINGVANEMYEMACATPRAGGAAGGDSQRPLDSREIYRRVSWLVGNPGLCAAYASHIRTEKAKSRQPGEAAADVWQPAWTVGQARTRLAVDVVAGTSAGGINGIFLAKALANGEAFGSLKDMWVNEGDMALLLNDERSCKEGFDPPLVPARSEPASLLNSDRMYLKLLQAMASMAPVPALQGAAGESLLAEEIDLFVTTTDIVGAPVPLRLADKVVYERRHKHSYHFAAPTGTGGGNDFAPANNAFLAFAARCTSSFPFAFEPMTLDVLPRLHAVGDAKGGVRQWDAFFAGLPKKLVSRGDHLRRAFGDGGYLDNKPFTYVVDALAQRQAAVPIERKLVYVEPAPQHLDPEEATPQAPPDALSNALAALTSIPQYETIREDLQSVLRRNQRIERVENLVRLSEDFIEEQKEPYLGVHTQGGQVSPWSTLKLSELVRFYGAAFLPYCRLRVFSLTDQLAEGLAELWGVDRDTDHLYALRALVRFWRETQFSDEAGLGDSKQTVTAFLDQFDIDHRLRRLRFLQRKVDQATRVLRLRRQLGPAPFADLDGVGKAALSDTDRKIVRGLKRWAFALEAPTLEPAAVERALLALRAVKSGLLEVRMALRRHRRAACAERMRRHPLDETQRGQLIAVLNLLLGVQAERDATRPGETPAAAVALRLDTIDGRDVPVTLADSWLKASSASRTLQEAVVLRVNALFEAAGKTSKTRLHEALEQSIEAMRFKRDPRLADAATATATTTAPANAISARAWELLGQPRLEPMGDDVVSVVVGTVPPRGQDGKVLADEAEIEALNSVEGRMLRRFLGDYYVRFDSFDQMSFPLYYDTGTGEPATVDIIRVSPEDAPALIDERKGGKRKKLAGTAVFNFGAFLDERWRRNDIMWGRLDGAERLVKALLPMSDDDTRVVREELVARAHGAILREALVGQGHGDLTALLCDAVAAVPGIGADARLAELLEQLQLGDPVQQGRLHGVLLSLLSEQGLLDYASTSYNVDRRLEPKATLHSAARAVTITGRVLDGIVQQRGVGTTVPRWLARVGMLLQGLAVVSVPGALRQQWWRHGLKLLYAFELVVFVLALLFGAEQARSLALTALAATFAAHLASLLIGDMMMSKVTWRRWCTRVAVAGVLLAAVLGVAALYTGTWLDVVKAAFARG